MVSTLGSGERLCGNKEFLRESTLARFPDQILEINVNAELLLNLGPLQPAIAWGDCSIAIHK